MAAIRNALRAPLDVCCRDVQVWMILTGIISYLSYETASNIRLVCRTFERAIRHRLNQGFSRAERYVQQALKLFRAQLPRRESERREHPLSRRVEHLAAVETRLGLLSMTYRRYMEMDACCFIPGKVLDEVFRVVRYLKEAPSVERSSFTVLQELRDISSMAMEHFEEHIVPGLKRNEARRGRSRCSLSARGSPAVPAAPRAAIEARNKSINVVEHSVAKLSQQVRAVIWAEGGGDHWMTCARVFIATNESCTDFYMCSHGVPYKLACPGELYFNVVTGQCDYKQTQTARCRQHQRGRRTRRPQSPFPLGFSDLCSLSSLVLNLSGS
ncbi:F-box only protein 28-like [Pollicipes pollicipes]|uniref:F-box only protein 28-like n=1 Tax=Pollicipes pollicipes TaxID=41117 RepID=UPI0018850415|nr:F-box only protein 28-like [Pollicipes pollicipes]